MKLFQILGKTFSKKRNENLERELQTIRADMLNDLLKVKAKYESLGVVCQFLWADTLHEALTPQPRIYHLAKDTPPTISNGTPSKETKGGGSKIFE